MGADPAIAPSVAAPSTTTSLDAPAVALPSTTPSATAIGAPSTPETWHRACVEADTDADPCGALVGRSVGAEVAFDERRRPGRADRALAPLRCCAWFDGALANRGSRDPRRRGVTGRAGGHTPRRPAADLEPPAARPPC